MGRSWHFLPLQAALPMGLPSPTSFHLHPTFTPPQKAPVLAEMSQRGGQRFTCHSLPLDWVGATGCISSGALGLVLTCHTAWSQQFWADTNDMCQPKGIMGLRL